MGRFSKIVGGMEIGGEVGGDQVGGIKQNEKRKEKSIEFLPFTFPFNMKISVLIERRKI